MLECAIKAEFKTYLRKVIESPQRVPFKNSASKKYYPKAKHQREDRKYV